MSDECECECENSDMNEISEIIMTILEGITFLCAIFVTILYSWEFRDKYYKKRRRRRRPSSCLPRIQSSNSIPEEGELTPVFDDT